MSTNVTLNGTTYSIPRTGDSNWSATGGVDDYLVAQATGLLQKSGGAFTLTAEADFGANYGLKAVSFKSRATNPATAGQVRLGNAEIISWRNAANGANLDLTVDSSNVLNFNGSPIVTLALGSANTALVMNGAGTAYSWAAIVNANISASAAIAYSKLALTGSVVNADVSASAAIAYSKLTLTSSIVNADVSASAAIAYSKLALTGSIVNADVGASAAIAYSKLSLSASIVNADVSASAAIAYSKLALTGSVVNADVSASAAIAYSKLTLTGSIVNADVSASAAIAYSKLNLASSVATADLASGLLVPITKGGTGQTTANAALNALLPSQTSNGGKLLSTDGSNTSWASAASSTLNQYNTDVGDSTNTRTAVNTNLLGGITATAVSQTYAVTSAAPGVFTVSSHGLSTGDTAYVTVTQNGFTANTTYYVHKIDANTFHLSTTYANAIGATYITSSGTTAGTIVSGGLVLKTGPANNRSPTVSKALYTSHTGGFDNDITGTYTTPAGVAWLRVRMVGGGGGGSAGGTAVNVASGAGGSTTFDSSIAVMGGGAGGGITNSVAGGTASTFSAPAVGFQVSGSNGLASMPIRYGGAGGHSFLGGGGAGGTVNGTGNGSAGVPNTGGGGGGSDGGGTQSGGGGGGGAYADFIIPSPAPGKTYSFTVGNGGAAGTVSAGGDGTTGGAGGTGMIIVEEHYF